VRVRVRAVRKKNPCRAFPAEPPFSFVGCTKQRSSLGQLSDAQCRNCIYQRGPDDLLCCRAPLTISLLLHHCKRAEFVCFIIHSSVSMRPPSRKKKKKKKKCLQFHGMTRIQFPPHNNNVLPNALPLYLPRYPIYHRHHRPRYSKAGAPHDSCY